MQGCRGGPPCGHTATFSAAEIADLDGQPDGDSLHGGKLDVHGVVIKSAHNFGYRAPGPVALLHRYGEITGISFNAA